MKSGPLCDGDDSIRWCQRRGDVWLVYDRPRDDRSAVSRAVSWPAERSTIAKCHKLVLGSRIRLLRAALDVSVLIRSAIAAPSYCDPKRCTVAKSHCVILFLFQPPFPHRWIVGRLDDRVISGNAHRRLYIVRRSHVARSLLYIDHPTHRRQRRRRCRPSSSSRVDLSSADLPRTLSRPRPSCPRLFASHVYLPLHLSAAALHTLSPATNPSSGYDARTIFLIPTRLFVRSSRLRYLLHALSLFTPWIHGPTRPARSRWALRFSALGENRPRRVLGHARSPCFLPPGLRFTFDRCSANTEETPLIYVPASLIATLLSQWPCDDLRISGELRLTSASRGSVIIIQLIRRSRNHRRSTLADTGT